MQLYAEAIAVAPEVKGRGCLSSDPQRGSNERVRRLVSGRGLGIRDASRCVIGEGGRMTDAISGERVVDLYVDEITTIEPGRAEGFGTFGLGHLWCGGGRYALQFDGVQWVVTPKGPRIVC